MYCIASSCQKTKLVRNRHRFGFIFYWNVTLQAKTVRRITSNTNTQSDVVQIPQVLIHNRDRFYALAHPKSTIQDHTCCIQPSRWTRKAHRHTLFTLNTPHEHSRDAGPVDARQEVSRDPAAAAEAHWSVIGLVLMAACDCFIAARTTILGTTSSGGS